MASPNPLSYRFSIREAERGEAVATLLRRRTQAEADGRIQQGWQNSAPDSTPSRLLDREPTDQQWSPRHQKTFIHGLYAQWPHRWQLPLDLDFSVSWPSLTRLGSQAGLASQSAQAAVTKDHRLGGLDSQTFMSHSPGAGKVKVKVTSDLAPPESSIPGLQMAVFLLNPHMGRGLEKEEEEGEGKEEVGRERRGEKGESSVYLDL